MAQLHKDVAGATMGYDEMQHRAHLEACWRMDPVDGLAVADKAVSVPSGEEWAIGPFPPGIYNDVNSKVQLTYDGVTGAPTIAVLQIGN